VTKSPNIISTIGAVAAQCEAGGDADDAGLADRCGDDLARKTGGQPLGDLEGSTVRVRDVLTQRTYP
jgi:hypothetical protein